MLPDAFGLQEVGTLWTKSGIGNWGIGGRSFILKFCKASGTMLNKSDVSISEERLGQSILDWGLGS